MRHKWSIHNKCEECGLERKYSRISPDNFSLYGHELWLFKENNEWVSKMPKCSTKEKTNEE